MRGALDSFGEIAVVIIPIDKATQKSKGIGFIMYKNDGAAAEAANEMDANHARAFYSKHTCRWNDSLGITHSD